ncbi:MAG: UDP-N-acetylmuramoyl-tripeptide--D-alanyl-D-alanine ligase [Paludibacteraceae bacterium]
MELYSIFRKNPTICTDSRDCKPHSIFFALKGENFDANAFALSALENGCAYAVVDNKDYAIDERFIVVGDVLETLQNLARHHRQKLGTKIIGITGTNGKTTTKELIASVMTRKFNTLYTQGNLNNHIGVPLTLLRLTEKHEIAIVEMGANHPGEIKFLSEIALPDYGIITNVGKAHLEGFGSFEGVMETKAELYDFILKQSGRIFLNTGNRYLNKMVEKSGFTDKRQILTYQLNCEKENKIAVGTVTANNPLLEMSCTTSEGGFNLKTNLIGEYNAENILAAVAIGSYFGIANEQIKQGLEKYQPSNNRSQFVQTKTNKLIVDAYNANPTSMMVALRNFTQINYEKKTVIVGDMLELGEQAAEEHQTIVDIMSETGISDIYLVGRQFSQTKHNGIAFADIEAFKIYLQNNPLENRFILIKGSHGIHLEKIIEDL